MKKGKLRKPRKYGIANDVGDSIQFEVHEDGIVQFHLTTYGGGQSDELFVDFKVANQLGQKLIEAAKWVEKSQEDDT